MADENMHGTYHPGVFWGSVGTAVAAAALMFGLHTRHTSTQSSTPGITYRAIPESVAVAHGFDKEAYVSLEVRCTDGNSYTMPRAPPGMLMRYDQIMRQVLQEINDGDQEAIEFSGGPMSIDRYRINRLKVNGQTWDLERLD